MRRSLFFFFLLIVAALAPVLTGCGASGHAATATAPSSGAGAPTGFIATADLDRQLSNTVRRGLRQLAVMQQPGDDAADLGQALPTGIVDRVRCDRPAEAASPAGGKARAACRVRWTTPDDAAHVTRYVVQLTDHGCFYANARPAFRTVYDATTHAPAAHPLDYLAGAIAGC